MATVPSQEGQKIDEFSRRIQLRFRRDINCSLLFKPANPLVLSIHVRLLNAKHEREIGASYPFLIRPRSIPLPYTNTNSRLKWLKQLHTHFHSLVGFFLSFEQLPGYTCRIPRNNFLSSVEESTV